MARNPGNIMQPTERIEPAEAPARHATPAVAGPALAHTAVILLRALAIAILAAPVVLGVVLLLK